MAQRYSLGTLLAIVIPISAVLLVALLLLLCCSVCLSRHRARIRHLNHQINSQTTEEHYKSHKKSHHHESQIRPLQIPWYQRLLYCGCCCMPEIEPNTVNYASTIEEGRKSRSPPGRHADSSGQRDATNQKRVPTIKDRRHEMELLRGSVDGTVVHNARNTQDPFNPEYAHGSRDDHRGSRKDRKSRPKSSRRTTKYVDAPEFSPQGPHGPAMPVSSSQVPVLPSSKVLATESYEPHRHYNYQPPQFQPPVANLDPSIQSASPKDSLPPVPLHMDSQGVILSDDEYNSRHYAKHSRSPPSTDYHRGDSQGQRIQSSIYSPSTSAKSPHLFSTKDTFPLRDQNYDTRGQDSQSVYKFLDAPIGLSKLKTTENKYSMIASYIDPDAAAHSPKSNSTVYETDERDRLDFVPQSPKLDPQAKRKSKEIHAFDPPQPAVSSQPAEVSRTTSESMNPRWKPVAATSTPASAAGKPKKLTAEEPQPSQSVTPAMDMSPSQHGEIPILADSLLSKSEGEKPVKEGVTGKSGPSFGTEWHEHRVGGTESSADSDFTYGTYATAHSKNLFDSAKSKEPMPQGLPELPSLDSPWQVRRGSQSTSSRASSLMFSASDRGNTTGSSHRKKSSINSSLRGKIKGDPTLVNKPLPRTPKSKGASTGTTPQKHKSGPIQITPEEDRDVHPARMSEPHEISASQINVLPSERPDRQQLTFEQQMLALQKTHPQIETAPKAEDGEGVIGNMRGQMFQAVFPYTPQLEDELRLVPKEIVRVYQVFDDGWCFAKKMNPVADEDAHGICPKVCLVPNSGRRA